MGMLDLKSRKRLSPQCFWDCSFHFWPIAVHLQLYDCAHSLSQAPSKPFFGILQRHHSWHLNWKSFVPTPSFSILWIPFTLAVVLCPFLNVIWSSRWQTCLLPRCLEPLCSLIHTAPSIKPTACRRCGRRASLLLGKSGPRLIHCCHLLGPHCWSGKADPLKELSQGHIRNPYVVLALISCCL